MKVQNRSKHLLLNEKNLYLSDIMKYAIRLCLILILISSISYTYVDKKIADPVKRFTLLSPDQTRIKFNNQIKDSKDANITLYSNFYGGAGVGVVDVNNDGLQDLYFAGNLVPDKLYLNKGNFQFEDISGSAGIKPDGGWSSSVLVADINKDGYQDIYVTRELYDDKPLLRANKLYINNKNNTFTERAKEYGLADTARTRSATFIDYDQDGDLDLLLLNQPPNPGDYSSFHGSDLSLPEYGIRLMQNDDKGHFMDVTESAGLKRTGFPNSVTASDLNGDGYTDLYISNDFWIGDWMFINQGDGTFKDKIHENVRHTSFSGMGVDAADINNDGMLDMIEVDMVAEDNYRLKANMSGMNPDAFWKVVADGGGHQYMFNMLHLNRGDAEFSDIAQLAGVANTDWSWSSLFADLDNDGWKDLYITNGLMRDIRNKDAHKAFAHSIETSVAIYMKDHPNLDKKVSIWDIVDIERALSLTPSVKLKNYVFHNNHDLTFTKQMDDWGLDQKTFSNGSAYADLDNDGNLDLIVNNINDAASIYKNNGQPGNASHYLRIKPVTDDSTALTQGTKVWIETSAGKQFFELTGMRGMYSTSEPIAHFGLGKETMVHSIKIKWPDGNEQELKEVKADQVLTILHSKSNPVIKNTAEKAIALVSRCDNSGINFIQKENKFDDYKTQVLLPHKMSANGPLMSAGDVNGDGLTDVFIGGPAGQAGVLFIQKADGSFLEKPNDAFVKDRNQEDMGSAFFDADGDGDQDLYVVSGGNEFLPGSKSYQDRLYLNDGQGNFTKNESALPQMNFSGSKVRPFDFDSDGDLDLLVMGRHVVWAYPMPASSVLLKNDGGVFSDVTASMARDLKDIGMVNDAAWADMDGDGKKDIVLTGEWMPILILLNKGDHFERKQDSPALNESIGWWFSLKTADIDGDGDEDILAGNLGLNYKYKASAKEPFEVYYYDFDDNGSKDVVLTYYNFGQKFPLRGRQCSSQQVPAIAEKFPTYDMFASSNVSQIYGEDKLEHALHNAATTFASTYFENKGNGQFEAHTLPVECQLSTINDMIIDDLNGDGHPDIITAGNMYNVEVETERADAGIGAVLLGDGKGQFRALVKAESGLDLNYDVKSLLKINTTRGKLLLAGCNNEPLKVYSFFLDNKR